METDIANLVRSNDDPHINKKYSAASFFDTLLNAFGSKYSDQNCTIRNDIEENRAYGANNFCFIKFASV